MSHFTVMVIGNDPEKQLAPYQENNMGDCPKQYLEWVSVMEDYENIDEAVEDGYKLKDGIPGYWENPNAKWDWYVLGGRWSGMIKIKEGASGVIGRSGTFRNDVGIDQAIKKDIVNLDDIVTFALIKDGEWYEQGRMGWFGVVFDEKDQWESEFKKLTENLNEDTLISIYDCHI